MTAVLSLTAQLVIGGITGLTFFFIDTGKTTEESSENDFLVPILTMELIVQAIELFWYSVVVLYYKEIITWTRYVDWAVTTPVMLVTTALFFLHRRRRRGETDDDTHLMPGETSIMLSFNMLMLSLGFSAETGLIPVDIAVLAGGLCLLVSYYVLFTFLDPEDVLSVILFSTMLLVWSLYGVAAILSYEKKNISYNLLDIVSKNFYGLFFFVYVVSV